ncbi:hypothetical protein CLU91_5433 [Janthinobacterium sp. 64]|nr:hypothetical protein CLU91_5433 [Janthinobacterium sp. 64]
MLSLLCVRRGASKALLCNHLESRDRLGKRRSVVERTLDVRHRFRRLRIRYEGRADIHQAFLSLACILICWRYIQRFC